MALSLEDNCLRRRSGLVVEAIWDQPGIIGLLATEPFASWNQAYGEGISRNLSK